MGQSQKPTLYAHDLGAPRRHCIKNQPDYIKNIIKWAQK